MRQNYDDRKIVKQYREIARQIVKKEGLYKNMDQAELCEQTNFWREKFKTKPMTERDKVNIFALAREAASRIIGLDAVVVQLIGALVLGDGKVAEMKTGEGKTLMSLFVMFIEVMRGNRVHLVTANEYLARRDREEIGQVLEYLGVSVALNESGLDKEQKKAIYTADVIYGTASEFGFDYLRDNMVRQKEDKVQSGLDFVLIDEADSILIDEARTPLLISDRKEEDLSLYHKANELVEKMMKDDYEMEEHKRFVWLNDAGIEKAQRFWKVDSLYSAEAQSELRITMLLMRAHFLMHKDKDYVVLDDEVLIIDPHTGRALPGRRFNDGLHQAIEAKEGVEVKEESRTLATITIQNYFRMYKKISGMTGTAKTEEEEFRQIYNMDVVVIPTNLRVNREDMQDDIFYTKKEKGRAIVYEVSWRYEKGQPTLIGTSSIKSNEWISGLLNAAGIPHQVLNAKNHAQEAEIIAKAGKRGMVTLATNMAGRGTDIKLDPDVHKLGGLAVIGTERHESRRIDLQLMGRSGRRGDPGFSKFMISLEDDLLEQFESKSWEKLSTKLKRKAPRDGKPVNSRKIHAVVVDAQKRLEGANYDIRKDLLSYDEVIDLQRKMVYKERDLLLERNKLGVSSEKILREVAEYSFIHPSDIPEEELEIYYSRQKELLGGTKFPLSFDQVTLMEPREVVEEIVSWHKNERNKFPVDTIAAIEREVYLNLMDQMWVMHLDAMVQLREGIHLRAYGQQDPLVMYQKEGAQLFEKFQADYHFYFAHALLELDPDGLIQG
ncbi:preprotein translocase subunit SecA [Listeria monocytogenes]|uniref:Protein translocase subunit SecA n=1 Tax=Listeria monocytogenes TaxID=1639 RepID=A0A823ISH6_LISMN|nr:accessory Sec system translocase SecA2 [Listeria monocytogenes]EAC8433241.1 accessory Sec system translocase SecA2 [Listeria monocytogenes]EAE5921250.1 accessory Sec system translocase SecA2 [Listeria monocytogenes]EAG6686883.1 accessory Sec system translocase SecA2 [Listeria monocytogenes]EAG9220849.1 accessory Sec system translocase SecA2 [Listeria monocytogenes]EAG9352713.1 accessory Sec system translocase SecA2 [Listeria monocytogenes]